MRGYHAYLADQTSRYDVVFDYSGKLLRVQVKATNKPIVYGARTVPVYKFGISRDAEFSKQEYSVDELDLVALVALDVKKIAWLKYDKRITYKILRVPGLTYRKMHGRICKTIDDFPFEEAIKDF